MQQHNPWLILLLTLYTAQSDAMVQTRDITRLPNCYHRIFAEQVAKKTLQIKHIDHQSASIKLVSVTKTRYKEFPEEYYCQGIIEYIQHGQSVSNVLIYHIGWVNNTIGKLRVKSTLYPFHRIGS